MCIKRKRGCQFKNNISSCCRFFPISGQDSNWLIDSGVNKFILKVLVFCCITRMIV
jgi:hypothetical protein